MKVKVFGFDFSWGRTTSQPVTTEAESANILSGSGRGNWIPVRSVPFDGEKTPGAMGNPINLYPNHAALRFRSYEAELKSDIVKIITGKFFKWVIGSGLNLQSEPNQIVLNSEGIYENLVNFRSLVEARFKIYSQSKYSDYSFMRNLHVRAAEAYKTAFLSGDCLVLLRVQNGNVNVQVIDGQNVVNPFADSPHFSEAKTRGNLIKSGIEVAPNGQHVAYYVVKEGTDLLYSVERIEARDKDTGVLMAWMIYGNKHRIDHHRGVPQLTPILEKVEKLDRYTEASVAGAEERAKIVFAIEHTRFSTGESPVIGNLRQNLGGGKNEDDPYKLGQALSTDIAATTEKQTFNLPIGAKLTTLASNQENQYEGFFRAVFMQLCAAVDIPPEVALQKYDSNYSASRAAIKGWDYIVDVYRKDFSSQFYQNFYSLWLYAEILRNKVPAPGYLKAIYENNFMAMEAYSFAKFTGVTMPNIDPLKEVNSVRRMLGDPTKGEKPLISHEQATENLNQGNWAENVKKYQEEEKVMPTPVIEEKTERTNETVS